MKLNLKLIGIVGGSVLGGAALGFVAGQAVEKKKNNEEEAVNEAVLAKQGWVSPDTFQYYQNSCLEAIDRRDKMIDRLQIEIGDLKAEMNSLKDNHIQFDQETPLLYTPPVKNVPVTPVSPTAYKPSLNPGNWGYHEEYDPPEDVPFREPARFGIDLYGEEDMTDDEINNSELIVYYVKDRVFADSHGNLINNPVAIIGENGYKEIIRMAAEKEKENLYVEDHDLKTIYRVEIEYDYSYKEDDNG